MYKSNAQPLQSSDSNVKHRSLVESETPQHPSQELKARRYPLPPFDLESATAKVQAAEDAWNTRDSKRVAAAYTEDSQWRNRDQFFIGRESIEAFLDHKWQRELHYKLMKELWAYSDNRISVRFEYEWQHADTGQWYRTHGNEHWEFDTDGYMRRRDMSANDVPISCGDRRIGISVSPQQTTAA